jgi:hypothetical protein
MAVFSVTTEAGLSPVLADLEFALVLGDSTAGVGGASSTIDESRDCILATGDVECVRLLYLPDCARGRWKVVIPPALAREEPANTIATERTIDFLMHPAIVC